jgi:hypothetical protein
MFGIGIFAMAGKMMIAEEAGSAGNRERHDDAVASLELGHGRADFLDDAHKFMAHYYSARLREARRNKYANQSHRSPLR